MKLGSYSTILALTAACGCVPYHDYAGDYAMTYDVILSFSDAGRAEVRAGRARVAVHDGLAGEYLIDLGAPFGRISGIYDNTSRSPHIAIAPQPCWFTDFGKTYDMSLAGSATFADNDARFTVVLSGTFRDPATDRFGSAVVELTESW